MEPPTKKQNTGDTFASLELARLADLDLAGDVSLNVDYEAIRTAFKNNPNGILSAIIQLHKTVASYQERTEEPKKQVEKPKNERQLLAELQKKRVGINKLKTECDELKALTSMSTPMDLPEYFTGEPEKLGQFLDAMATKHGDTFDSCENEEEKGIKKVGLIRDPEAII
ncbi:uncharacterized protein PAC_17142 [Phialocephala subalpina]|uniref:Uncharacterized protein n=1 Tax=Phialocephala subalpina TaxID=576137 RepID=A0A1L7XQD7_9HELO|nr:uncharacterized protein PAC_17142 [Phialocephala subalpina]